MKSVHDEIRDTFPGLDECVALFTRRARELRAEKRHASAFHIQLAAWKAVALRAARDARDPEDATNNAEREQIEAERAVAVALWDATERVAKQIKKRTLSDAEARLLQDVGFLAQAVAHARLILIEKLPADLRRAEARLEADRARTSNSNKTRDAKAQRAALAVQTEARAGLSPKEIAATAGVSVRTVQRVLKRSTC